MEVGVITITCDAPGCKSRCQLAPEHHDMVCEAIEKRGWLVENESGTAAKHYCPVHAKSPELDK